MWQYVNYRFPKKEIHESIVVRFEKQVDLHGDTLFRRDINEFRSHFSEECEFVNRLTSTETNTVTLNLIKPGTKIDNRIVPVGYRAQDKEVLIIDEEGNELGLNEMGEIVIKSRYITSGYWGKIELEECVLEV